MYFYLKLTECFLIILSDLEINWIINEINILFYLWWNRKEPCMHLDNKYANSFFPFFYNKWFSLKNKTRYLLHWMLGIVDESL